MRIFIKTVLPQPVLLMIKKIYRIVVSKNSKIANAYKNSNKLNVLDCKVSYNKYGGYCVPSSSYQRPAAKAVLSGKVYEPDTLEYMRSRCGSLDIVHAGAFFGDFLPALASVVSADSIVWAFEPNRENYRCAKITADINDLKNVRLVHAGLGCQRDTLRIQTTDASGRSLGGGSRIKSEADYACESESVNIVTIDEIIPSNRNVGILQLDVEGYEKEALIGAIRTIKRCLPVILIENLPESTLLESEWFDETILSLGYKARGRLHRNVVFSCQGDG